MPRTNKGKLDEAGVGNGSAVNDAQEDARDESENSSLDDFFDEIENPLNVVNELSEPVEDQKIENPLDAVGESPVPEEDQKIENPLNVVNELSEPVEDQKIENPLDAVGESPEPGEDQKVENPLGAVGELSESEKKLLEDNEKLSKFAEEGNSAAPRMSPQDYLRSLQKLKSPHDEEREPLIKISSLAVEAFMRKSISVIGITFACWNGVKAFFNWLFGNDRRSESELQEVMGDFYKPPEERKRLAKLEKQEKKAAKKRRSEGKKSQKKESRDDDKINDDKISEVLPVHNPNSIEPVDDFSHRQPSGEEQQLVK